MMTLRQFWPLFQLFGQASTAANSPLKSVESSPIASENDENGARVRRWMWWVFWAALGARVFVVCWLNYAPVAWRPTMSIFAPDSTAYDALAKGMLSGAGYQFGGDFREATRIPPLFPYLLSLEYRLWGGETNVPGVGFINALFGALNAVLLFDFARRCVCLALTNGKAIMKISPARAGLWAGMMFAFYPLEVFNTPYVLKENFSILLTTGFVWSWARWLECEFHKAKLVASTWATTSASTSANSGAYNWSAQWAILAGVLLGLSILSRYTHQGLLLVLWLCNWLLLKRFEAKAARRRVLGQTVLASVFCLLAMSPWLVRNYNVWGSILLSSHGPGRALYGANSQLAKAENNGYFEGHGSTYDRMKPVEDKHKTDPNAQDRAFTANALREIVQSPGHVANLVAGKLMSMWRPVWAKSQLRTHLILGVPYIVMMLFALPGMVLAWRWRGAHPLLIPLFGATFYYVVGHAVFYGMIRERQFVEPYLIIFAAYAALHWFNRKNASNAL